MGATWSTEPIDLPLGRYRSISAGNADMIELADGTLLLTLHYYYYVEMEEEAALPFDQQASFGYVLRSTDGGRTWPEAHCHLLYGGEAHLLELPSGKILVASRKQRSSWLPGDPEDIVVTMRANGYDPEYTGYHEPIAEGDRVLQAHGGVGVERRRPNLGERAAGLRLRAVLGRADPAGRRLHRGAHLRLPLSGPVRVVGRPRLG